MESGEEAPRPLGKAFKPDDIAREFRRNRQLWTPEILGRVKKAADVAADPQLDLFNRGLLPVLEKFFGRELKILLEAAFATTVECYRSVHSAEPDVRSLFPFLFRFVTAKIFIDRKEARGWDGLGTPQQIFQKAEDHSGSGLLAKLPPEFLHQRVLAAAWESISGSLNFQNLWVPDLAEIYESAFITKATRKQLGTHSTPHGLAEYVVNHLPWETLPVERRRVFSQALARLPLPPEQALAVGSPIDKLARRVQSLFAEDTLLADMKPTNWREERREALIRLDAAVLDAYGLSAAEQRKLLDQFQGHRRPVGFEFTGYFPEHFKDDLTLSDFVRINYDWDETDDRRCDLIQKKIYGGGLDAAETAELEHLQHLTDLLVRLKDPHPVSQVDALIEELKAEGKWPASI